MAYRPSTGDVELLMAVYDLGPKWRGRKMKFGFNDDFQVHIDFSDRISDIANIAKVNIFWSMIDSGNDNINWTWFDDTYDVLHGLGIKPIFNVCAAPNWAAGPGSGVLAPMDSHEHYYAEFCQKVAVRYRDITGIQIWNEPNYSVYASIAPAKMQRMMKLCEIAIHEARPSVRVIGPGLSPGGEYYSYDWRRYERELYESLPRRYRIDSALHFYPSLPDPLGQLHGHIQRLQSYRRRVWITEIGAHAHYYPEDHFDLAADYMNLADVMGVAGMCFHRLREVDNAIPGYGPGSWEQLGKLWFIEFTTNGFEPLYYSVHKRRLARLQDSSQQTSITA